MVQLWSALSLEGGRLDTVAALDTPNKGKEICCRNSLTEDRGPEGGLEVLTMRRSGVNLV